MANLSEKLQALAEKEQKLVKEKGRLIERRKHEIGALVEKVGLLTVPDDILVGVLLRGKAIIDAKSNELDALIHTGGEFLNGRNTKTNTKTRSKA